MPQPPGNPQQHAVQPRPYASLRRAIIAAVAAGTLVMLIGALLIAFGHVVAGVGLLGADLAAVFVFSFAYVGPRGPGGRHRRLEGHS
jgi:hypothetical protein